MKVFGEEGAQLLTVLRPTTEATFARRQKVFKLFVILDLFPNLRWSENKSVLLHFTKLAIVRQVHFFPI